MTYTKEKTMQEEVRVLTEDEIQDRLYGEYLGRRKKKKVFPVELPADLPVSYSKAPDPEWSGVEILKGELSSLRDELIALRRERDVLAAKLQSADRPAPAPGPAVRPAPLPPVKSENRIGHLLGRIVGVGLLVVGCGYAVGVHPILQASPVGAESSPYTVQVAVYDVKGLADQAVERLRTLGYSAFLVDLARRDGRPRYRIYVGQFVTKAEANLERQRLTGDPRFSDAFVLFR